MDYQKVNQLEDSKDIESLKQIKNTLQDKVSSLIKERVFCVMNKRSADTPELDEQIAKLQEDIDYVSGAIQWVEGV